MKQVIDNLRREQETKLLSLLRAHLREHQYSIVPHEKGWVVFLKYIPANMVIPENLLYWSVMLVKD